MDDDTGVGGFVTDATGVLCSTEDDFFGDEKKDRKLKTNK
jgi:hypothetical protein